MPEVNYIKKINKSIELCKIQLKKETNEYQRNFLKTYISFLNDQLTSYIILSSYDNH
jgi:hypothetical protein